MKTVFNKVPEVIFSNRLKHVQLLVTGLFTKNLLVIALAGRPSNFSNESEILIKHKDNFLIAKGYKIPFISVPQQVEITCPAQMSKIYNHIQLRTNQGVFEKRNPSGK